MQTRTVTYHAPDTSRLHNRQLSGVVRPGVYRGFKLRVNAADTNRLDITHGGDSVSVLVTAEGVRIEEDAELSGAIAIENADPNLVRIDLVVAEYRFTTDNRTEMTYRALRGRYAATGATPLPPTVESEYQIPLATVTVRPQTAYGGAGRARLTIDDVVHVGRAGDVRAPLDVSSLMPIVEPSDRRRIFVHAGLLPSFDGTAKIAFPGGYSAVLDPETLAPNATAYYLFGVSDDRAVVLIGSAASEDELPAFTRDVFPVCSVKARNIDDKIVFLELTDLRFPFARQLSPVLEEEVYKATLAGSVFKHVRVDLFRDLTGIVADSVSDAGVSVAVDRGTTALKLAAATVPDDDVSVATKNLLRDTAIGTVEHFMVVAETDFDGLEIQFSTTGPYSGFVSARAKPNTIVRVPSGGAARLYLRFIVPAAAFEGGKTPQIFSYGCFMIVDEGVLNADTLSDVGVNELKNAVPNLIANGNFRHWSRDDVNGNPTDPDGTAEIAYPLDAEHRFAADGWQFVELGFEAADGQVRRVGLSADVLDAEIDNAADTALAWRGAGGSGGVNVLEFRVPVPAGAVGRRFTFSVSYRTNNIAAVGVGIALYERTPQKTLRLQGAPARAAAAVATGELTVQSATTAGESTYCVGFRIYLTQTTGESRVWVWNARAAVGEFRTLPYNEAPNATDVLRKYYERGRVYAAQNAAEGDVVGASVQFGARKASGLGVLEAQVVPFPDSNRSVNIADPAFEATADGVVVTAPAVSAGQVRIDLDFEAYVRYASAV